MSTLALSTLLSSARCEDKRNTWSTLKELPRKRSFVFVNRDLSCQAGQIIKVEPDRILIRSDKSEIEIEKAKLLQIRAGRTSDPSVNPFLPLTVVYSGRSSWSDILSFMPFVTENPSSHLAEMSVTPVSGKPRKGQLQEVTSSGITLRDSSGKDIEIPKTEISYLDFVQVKPLSDDQEFYWEELAMFQIFDPILYPRLFHVGATMPVRLYNRSLPQDDSPVKCASAPGH